MRAVRICQRTGRALAIGAGTLLAWSTACAQAPSSVGDLENQVTEQGRLIERQNAQLAQQARELEEIKRTLSALRQDLERLAGTMAQAEPPPRKTAQDSPTTGGSPPPSEVGKEVNKDQPPATAAVSPISQQASVLTPYGHWSLEPSLQYAYSSKDQVSILGVSILPAITVGLIDVERVSQTLDVAALTARYGVAPRTEIELRVPYVYADQDTVGRPFGATGSSDIVTGAHGHGIGDVEIASRYQLEGAGPSPYLIGEARIRMPSGRGPFNLPLNAATGLAEAMPTGTGFWGAFAAATAIYQSDPAVFFGSLNYLWNVGRNVSGGAGYVRPGNSIGLNFGSGLSLNEFASLSIGYEQDWLSKTTEGGVTLPSTTGLQVGRLLIGYSYRLSARTTLNVSLAIGATDAAPNTQMTIRIPYAF